MQAWVDEMHLGYKEPQLSNERTEKPAVTCKRTGDGGVSYTADKTRAFDWTLDLSEWKYIRSGFTLSLLTCLQSLLLASVSLGNRPYGISCPTTPNGS